MNFCECDLYFWRLCSQQSYTGMSKAEWIWMVCIWAWQRSKSPWSLTKKIPVFCWNPQDFHFSINYSFSDSLRPSWPQSLFSVEFLLNGKLIEQLWKIERLFPPSFELGTFRVWGERDNHCTTETCLLEESRNFRWTLGEKRTKVKCS